MSCLFSLPFSGIKPLSLNKLRKGAAFFDQFLVGTLLRDLSVIDQKDPVAVADSAETVGNDDSCTVQAVKSFRNLLLGLVVQGAGRLIQYQDIGLWSDRAGDHESLLLTAGDAALSFRNNRVHSHGHIPDILCDPGDLGSLPGVVQCQLRCGDRDIGEDISLEKLSVLGHDAHFLSQRAGIDLVQITAVIVDRALLGFFKSQKETDKSGFSASGPADNSDIISRVDLQGEVIQD